MARRKPVGRRLATASKHYESDTDFDSFKCTHGAYFRGDHFTGRLELHDADLFSLYIEGPLPGTTGVEDNVVSLNLSQAHIGHTFEIKNVSLGPLQAGFLDAEGPTTFENVVPLGHVDLNHSHFRNLRISGFDRWLAKEVPNDFRLEGLNFDGIEIAEAPEPSAMKLLDLIKSARCPFSPQPFLELEKFLRSHGNPNEADRTYIEMRYKELHQLSIWRQPFDLMLGVLVGYGRRPERSVIFALVLVAFGGIIFRRNRMDHADAEDKDEWYSRFWYSLDLLWPIDLGVSKKWRPISPILRNYAQIHRVAGWILIPLILAAITGIIK